MTNLPVDILLIEDNPNDIKLALHAFRKQNLAEFVHVVRDGAEAMEFLFATARYEDRSTMALPKVILLDLKLPLVDGVEVLRRIKGDERLQPVPVVILTSSQEERDLMQCYRLGANSYLVKPVDFDQFNEVVHCLSFYWLKLNCPPCPCLGE